jgi:riboflavin kinase/FMN adenylyltransferase
VLGHDARLGKDRQGNSPAMHQLAATLNFNLHYLAPYKVDGITASSSLIRQAIANGDLLAAEQLLGRKYAIESTANDALESGRPFYLSDKQLAGLCLPPTGAYEVSLQYLNRRHRCHAELINDATQRELKIAWPHSPNCTLTTECAIEVCFEVSFKQPTTHLVSTKDYQQ